MRLENEEISEFWCARPPSYALRQGRVLELNESV